jgi:hypothetical protein
MTEEITRLRNDYRACLKLATETDSKKDDVYFRSEAQKSLEELQKICSHEFVVVLNSYQKTYSSYESSDPERRICLICGIKEQAMSQSHFHQLKQNPLSRFEENAPPEVEHPLEYLLEESKELALEKGSKYFGFDL